MLRMPLWATRWAALSSPEILVGFAPVRSIAAPLWEPRARTEQPRRHGRSTPRSRRLPSSRRDLGRSIAQLIVDHLIELRVTLLGFRSPSSEATPFPEVWKLP